MVKVFCSISVVHFVRKVFVYKFRLLGFCTNILVGFSNAIGHLGRKIKTFTLDYTCIIHVFRMAYFNVIITRSGHHIHL